MPDCATFMNRAAINNFKTAMLIVTPAAIWAALGHAIAGNLGLVLCAVVYSSLATTAFLCADRLILKQYGAEYVPESRATGLYALVGELCRRVALPPPALYLLPEAAPQLLVTGRSAKHGVIAFSKGLLALLSTAELAAVTAHALDHVRSGETRPMTMAAALVQGLISVSNHLRWSNLLGPKLVRTEEQFGLVSDALLWFAFAPIAAAIIRGVVYPSRQFRADQASAHLIGDTNPLRQALAKIEAYTPATAPNSVSVATAHLLLCSPMLGEHPWPLFRSHPRFDERLRRLEDLGRTIQYFQRLARCSSPEELQPTILREERTNI